MTDKIPGNERIVVTAVKDGALKGLRTARMLLVIMVPIYIVVVFLRHTGLFFWLAGGVEPAMRIFGLPGEAVVPLIAGVFSDEYSVVAALSVFAFDKAQITTIAMITLCFHSIPVEAVVTQRIGMSAWRLALFRLGLAIVTGIACAYLASVFLNGTAPMGMGSVAHGAQAARTVEAGLAVELGLGTLSIVINLLRVIIPLMIAIEIMLVFDVTSIIARKLTPFCRLLGIGHDALLPLLVALLLGVTYGAGALSEMNRTRPLSRKDLALLGVFVFSCHGILETTYLFTVAGGSAVFISALRLAIAVVVTAAAARIYPFFITSK